MESFTAIRLTNTYTERNHLISPQSQSRAEPYLSSAAEMASTSTSDKTPSESKQLRCVPYFIALTLLSTAVSLTALGWTAYNCHKMRTDIDDVQYDVRSVDQQSDATFARLEQTVNEVQVLSENVVQLKGEQGEQGPVGPKGDTGEKGDRGLNGSRGEKGDAGIQGPPGVQGPSGKNGSVGPQGPAGEKGERGNNGSMGVQGSPGLPGSKGDMGERGVTGEKGEIGELGPSGEKGEQGNVTTVFVVGTSEANTQSVSIQVFTCTCLPAVFLGLFSW